MRGEHWIIKVIVFTKSLLTVKMKESEANTRLISETKSATCGYITLLDIALNIVKWKDLFLKTNENNFVLLL